MGLAETQEEEIKSRLATKLGSAIECEVVPEKTIDFKRSIGLKPIVTVSYSGATYTTPKSTQEISQPSEEVFEIWIRAKLLRGTNGIYDLNERIRVALVGFRPSSCNKMYLKEFKLESFEENLWTYSLKIGCSSMIIEDFSEEEGPIITQAKATYTNNNYN